MRCFTLRWLLFLCWLVFLCLQFFGFFTPIFIVVIILWLVVCYVCIVFAFSVKLPMFMVHLLLAHVEAHISGSMILAWCV